MARNNEQTSKKKKSKRGLRILGTVALIALVTGAMLACMAAMYIKVVIIPDSEVKMTDYDLNLTTSVYYTDDNGQNQELERLHGTENRIWIEYEKMPQNLIDATVCIEDKRFYKHNGVDWIRTVKGVLSMLTGQKIEGGSTITQQLIKNLTTENQVTVKRKIREIFRALEFENNYTKDDILEAYLNYIFLGEGCNGVYTASYAYFGKHVSELSLAECASLIGITNNPSLYNPYRNAEANRERQVNILYAMLDQGKITQSEYDQAMAEELTLVRGEDENRQQVVYSWYVDTVIDEVIADLIAKFNWSPQVAADTVYSGGLQIYTGMNKTVQDAVESVYLNRANLNYTSPSGQSLQSAITVVDNKTGNVVAIAGGMGEKTNSRVLNRAKSKRQPGSAIKPLSVYAPALELGFITPVSTEHDSPVEGSWPNNAYEGYRGTMTMTEAMRISSNTVSVKVLDKLVTPEVSFAFMEERFHFKLVKSQKAGDKILTDVALASLGLGGLTSGLTPYDMAAAYSVFPRGGVYYEPKTYTKVLSRDGTVLLESNTEGEVVLKPKTTYYMNEMLQVVVQNNGTGKNAKLNNMSVAGKTGTTDSKKDYWFVGYTPYYTAAVWTGYDQPEPVRNIKSGSNPSPILWKQVMEPVHKNLPMEKFTAPESSELISVPYCKISGNVANDYCPSRGTISLMKDDIGKTCTIHKKPVAPPSFDINNEATWPQNDPNFRPEDPSTWPGATVDPGVDDGTATPPTTPTPEEPVPEEAG